MGPNRMGDKDTGGTHTRDVKNVSQRSIHDSC